MQVAPVLERYGRFRDFMGTEANDAAAFRALRQSETTGRPLGSDDWIEELENRTGRTLKAQKRGPKQIQSGNR